MPHSISGRRLRRPPPDSRKGGVPTYEQDVTGEIARWDERDILFARKDLFRYFGVGSAAYRQYYADHPEHLPYDEKLTGLAGLGRDGGIDTAMFEAQFDITARLGIESLVEGEPAPQRIEVSPARAAEKVKALARFLGADLAKIGPLRPEWVYSHVGRSRGDAAGFRPRGTPIEAGRHPHAIAMGFQMDYVLSSSAPDFPTLLATARGYALGAWVSVQLAEYIRGLGYSARAHHLTNYEVLAVPVAVDCGLGELSRAGFLLTSEFGLACRLAIVTTDLPLAHDRPVDLGIQSFCEQCQICADECPIGAIPAGDKTACNGIRKWKLDEEKCYRHWHAVGTDCGICMMACPWTQPDTALHRAMSRLATIKGRHQGLMAQASRLLYGRHRAAPRPAYLEQKGRRAAGAGET